MIKKIAQGLPSDTVTTIFDFIDTIWTDLVAVLALALIGMLWDFFVNVFIDLSATWGFLLIMFIWCFMFYVKFIEGK